MKTKTTVIAAILIAITVTSASAETLFISPAEIQCPEVGNTLSITVDISGAEDVYGIEFDTLYDSEALDFLTVEKGDFLPSAFMTDPVLEDGKLNNIAITKLSGGGEDGNGIVLYIDFNVTKIKESELLLSDVKILDSGGGQIDGVTTESATIMVQECPLKGDYPPCDGEVTDSELLSYIDRWALGLVSDFDLLDVIDSWTS